LAGAIDALAGEGQHCGQAGVEIAEPAVLDVGDPLLGPSNLAAYDVFPLSVFRILRTVKIGRHTYATGTVHGPESLMLPEMIMSTGAGRPVGLAGNWPADSSEATVGTTVSRHVCIGHREGGLS
jgi:hypothetical protein